MAIKFEATLFFLVVLLLIGCDKKEQTYYNDKKVKSTFYVKDGKKEGLEKIFYPSGELMVLTNYKNGVFVDSIVKFNKDGSYKSILLKKADSLFLKNYENNILISQGKVNDKMEPKGWWEFFKKNKIILQEETILFEGKNIINRQKIFNDGIYDSIHSKTYTFIKPKNILTNKQYPFEVKFKMEEKGKNLLDESYYYLLISPDINKDFSNLGNISFDTLVPKNNKFIYNIGFREAGHKTVRAIIEKHTLTKDTDNKTYIIKSRLFVVEDIMVKAK